ncbi:hypothetical protein Q3G72_024783 [Acer saccharum]|nr:hypothetical protein Q3G72_024783 [Acer saccharum]
MEPLSYGKYPASMRGLVTERLPKFTKKQTRMVKGSYDFIGINYYTAIYAVDVPITNSSNISCYSDSLAILTTEREVIPMRKNHFQCVKITKAIHKHTCTRILDHFKFL